MGRHRGENHLLSLRLAAVVLSVGATASAIVVSDDPDLHEVVAPSDYDGVGQLLWNGKGDPR